MYYDAAELNRFSNSNDDSSISKHSFNTKYYIIILKKNSC